MKKMFLLFCSLCLMTALQAQIIRVPANYSSIQKGADKLNSVGFQKDNPMDSLFSKLHINGTQLQSDPDTIYTENFNSGALGWTFQDLWSESFWHVSTTGAYSGHSYWCGIEELGGYDDIWTQTLTSPPVSLTGTTAPILTFMHNFRAEPLSGGYYTGTDAWDAMTVRLSTDGVNFTVIKPIAGLIYNVSSALGFWSRYGTGIAGWAGNSGGWIAANFNLTAYTGQTVWIQFLFGSDGAYSHQDDNTLFGWRVDNVKIMDGATTIFADDAGDTGSAQFVAGGPGGPNLWHITNTASVSTPSSAGCFDKTSGNYLAGMNAGLISPPIAINSLPSETWGLIANFQYKGALDPTNDGINGDGFRIEVRKNIGGAWSYWNFLTYSYSLPGSFHRYNESNYYDLDISNLIGADSIQFQILVLTRPDGNVVPPANVFIDDFTIIAKSGFAGPQFSAFFNRVMAEPEPNRTAIVDSFIATIPSFPFIEGKTIAYFLYRGNANTITVPGDANGWNTGASPMTRIPGTNLWYMESIFEPDARLDYKFVINGNNWILDPLNPKQVSGGFGPNSELAMPDYIQPPEIEFYPAIPHGTFNNQTISSTILSNSRSIRVYMPPSYASAVTDSFPVVLFHDGLDYINLMKVNNVLDYLISENRIRPVIAVFVPPVDRDNEYAYNKTSQFESFIIDELMPLIDAQYRTRHDPASRAMIGSSYGGLISTQICYNRPQSFGLFAPFSPSYSVKNMEVYKQLVNGPKKEIKVYLDWGSYENEIMVNSMNMRDNLTALNYEMTWNEWHEAHSCGNWRAHLDIALEYFFPAIPVGMKDVRFRNSDVGIENYPNPFKGSTTFTYTLPESAKVSLQVFNNLGVLVAEPSNEFHYNGEYKVTWNAGSLPAGIYYCRLQAGNHITYVKILKMH